MPKFLADDTHFEQWVEWVFDHPVTEPEWYMVEKGDWWEGSAVTRVEFVTRLFEAPATHLRGFSDAQASQGLWFLASSIFFEGLSSMFDAGVLRSQRQRCIASVDTLFEEYFAVRCSPHLSEVDEAGANPLNVTCYMWWDFVQHLAREQGRHDPEIDAEILPVLAKILTLNHDACRKSALHGLGHWQQPCPEKVAVIIDSFLANNPDLRPELRTYALEARAGKVQ